MTANAKSPKTLKATIRLTSILTTTLVMLLQYSARADSGETPKSTPELPRSSPEGQGIASSAILAFVDEADHKIDHLHSFMLVRHGHVVAEGWWTPYEAGTRHELYSLSKSFTSTAVGLAIADGKLSLDDPVLKFFPDEAPAELSANLKAMRVRDLLCMSTGHQTEPRLVPFLALPTATEDKGEARITGHIRNSRAYTCLA